MIAFASAVKTELIFFFFDGWLQQMHSPQILIHQ